MNKLVLALLAFVASAGISPLFANGTFGCGACGHGSGVSSGAGNASTPESDDYAMGRRLIHFEKYADAIPYLARARNERPHDSDTLTYLGYAHHMVGDDDIALDEYQAALKEDADHLLAHEYLGELYLGTHNPVSAQSQLSELVRLCLSNCDERDALTKAIATYRAATSAVPATPAKISN